MPEAPTPGSYDAVVIGAGAARMTAAWQRHELHHERGPSWSGNHARPGADIWLSGGPPCSRIRASGFGARATAQGAHRLAIGAAAFSLQSDGLVRLSVAIVRHCGAVFQISKERDDTP
jgi:hypothetical protein